jgi:hypothetical protein
MCRAPLGAGFLANVSMSDEWITIATRLPQYNFVVNGAVRPDLNPLSLEQLKKLQPH